MDRLKKMLIESCILSLAFLVMVAGSTAEGDSPLNEQNPLPVDPSGDTRTPEPPRESQGVVDMGGEEDNVTRVVYISIIVASCAIGIAGFAAAAICWFRARKLTGLAQKTDYPAYGVTGPNPLHSSYEPKIDSKLNKSAEVFHYNQTKK
uniref:Uncharacterized protein n=1 Tax=Ciona savignyi TaxID=51511 RepID=H2YM33_CIOSA